MSRSADLLALADTLRRTADEMESVGTPAAQVRKVRDAADECDAAAMRNVMQERAA